MQCVKPMIHNTFSLLSFRENELGKKNTPIHNDIKVTKFKRRSKQWSGETYDSKLVYEPDSYVNNWDINQYEQLIYDIVLNKLTFDDDTLKIDCIGHGSVHRDTIVIRAIYKALNQMFALAYWTDGDMRLKHIIIELYGCQVHKDYQYAPFWNEVKKIASLNIPLVIAFGGVKQDLTTDQFLYSQFGYSDKLNDVMYFEYNANFRYSFAKYAIATFNGAEVVSMKADFNYIRHPDRFQQKPTYLMLCPFTRRGVWANGSETLWDAQNQKCGICAPRICFYQGFIRTSYGIPEECFGMRRSDFKTRFTPKFLKN